jgi:hypothetical protein
MIYPTPSNTLATLTMKYEHNFCESVMIMLEIDLNSSLDLFKWPWCGRKVCSVSFVKELI